MVWGFAEGQALESGKRGLWERLVFRNALTEPNGCAGFKASERPEVEAKRRKVEARKNAAVGGLDLDPQTTLVSESRTLGLSLYS